MSYLLELMYKREESNIDISCSSCCMLFMLRFLLPQTVGSLFIRKWSLEKRLIRCKARISNKKTIIIAAALNRHLTIVIQRSELSTRYQGRTTFAMPNIIRKLYFIEKYVLLVVLFSGCCLSLKFDEELV